jgi:serine phosphatase RsbU (regulator of sigma subunit)
MLTRLNECLAGRTDGGFVTCVCALITPDGLLTLANAGHLSPYRNGVEVACEPGLPLGIVRNADYGEVSLQLGAGDTLTFISDGVVEARSAQGELFGFERTLQISGLSARRIAEAAAQFGQEDDITVLSISYPAAVAMA